MLWKNVRIKIWSVLCPSIPNRLFWRCDLNLACLLVLPVKKLRWKRFTPLRPISGAIWVLQRSDKIISSDELMTVLNVLKSSSDFVGKEELHFRPRHKVNPLNHILKMSLMYNPPGENWIIGYILNISSPIMMGRLAGKIRYPLLSVKYKDCFGWGRLKPQRRRNEGIAEALVSLGFACLETEAFCSYASL